MFTTSSHDLLRPNLSCADVMAYKLYGRANTVFVATKDDYYEVIVFTCFLFHRLDSKSQVLGQYINYDWLSINVRTPLKRTLASNFKLLSAR